MMIFDSIYLDEKSTRPVVFSTTDGRLLRVDPRMGCDLNCRYELSRVAAASNDLPVDGVSCRIWLADNEGRVWSSISQFTSEYFVDELAFANFENNSGLRPFEEAPAEEKRLFATSLVLNGVTYCSDDRFYRSMRIGTEWVQVIFKYSCLVFDVAFKESNIGMTALCVRLREGCDYDPTVPLPQIKSTDELPSLVFVLTWKSLVRMMYAHGACCTTQGSWVQSPLPERLVFELTSERDEPQSAVQII